jgi:hypothetical protein
MKTLVKPAAKKTIVRISPAKKAAQEKLAQCIRIRPFAEIQVNKAIEETGAGTSGHREAAAYLAKVDEAIAECKKALK